MTQTGGRVQGTGGPTAAEPGGLAWERPVDGVMVARLSGEVDSDTVPALEGAIERAMRRSAPRRVVIDLSAVTRMSLTGVGLLMLVRRRARTAGVHVVLSGCSGRCVAQPLRLSGVLPLFDTRIDVAHAVGRCGGPGVSIPGPRRRGEAGVG